MKYRSIIISFWAAVLLVATTGCGSDGTDEAVFPNNLSLSEDYIEMEPNESFTVDILDGNGGYTATSMDTQVAVVSVAGEKLEVSGIRSGRTIIIVTDRNGVQGLITVLLYGLVLDKAEVNVIAGDRDFGFPATTDIVKVLDGNGDYTLSSTEDDLLFTITDNEISVESYVVGVFSATIVDKAGRSAELTIICSDRYEDFKSSTADSYVYNGSEISSYYTIADLVQNDYFMYRRYYGYGTDIYYDFQVKVPVAQTLNVGAKQGCTFHYYSSYPSVSVGTANAPLNVNLWVLKNEGGRVWILFSSADPAVEFNGRVCRLVLAT